MLPTEISACPHCAADLAYEVDGKAYSRAIGVEIAGVYDGALFWHCPACGQDWHRWPEGDRLRARAEPYMNRRGNRPTRADQ